MSLSRGGHCRLILFKRRTSPLALPNGKSSSSRPCQPRGQKQKQKNGNTKRTVILKVGGVMSLSQFKQQPGAHNPRALPQLGLIRLLGLKRCDSLRDYCDYWLLLAHTPAKGPSQATAVIHGRPATGDMLAISSEANGVLRERPGVGGGRRGRGGGVEKGKYRRGAWGVWWDGTQRACGRQGRWLGDLAGELASQESGLEAPCLMHAYAAQTAPLGILTEGPSRINA